MKNCKYWILVNYNSCSDIHELISIHGTVYNFIVIDNSNNYSRYNNEIVISPKNNVGYIGGFKLALKALNNSSKCNIIFSNSDIRVIDGLDKFFESALKLETVIIPRIISPRGEQNPHILERKKKIYWYIRYFVSRNDIFWFLWNSLSYIKNYFSRAKNILNTKKVYAGHGSFYIFNRVNFSSFINDNHNFLFGEEVHFAEYFFSKKISVYYNPILIIQHNEHATTSLFKSSIRRKWFYESYKSILSKYYN